MTSLTAPEDILAQLASCWCRALSTSVGGSPAYCCVSVGQPAVVDCCGGVAWVRLVSAYPTVAFPAVATQAQNCMSNAWAIVVEVGIQRCAPAACDELGNVCCDSANEAAQVQLSDWAAMRRLFVCDCLGISTKNIVIGQYRATGPEGGCTGATLTATIYSQPDCDCS